MNLRKSPSGFTIIELMVAVTILMILTTVAVVSYKRSMRKGRMTEAIAMLGDIKMKQATYFSLYGQYVDTSASASSFTDSDYYPTEIGGGGKTWEIVCPDDQSSFPGWCSLGTRPANPNDVNFQYVTVGWATGDGDPPSAYIMDPNRHWWFAVARGDLDDNGVFSTFILSSEIPEAVVQNESE